MPTYKSLLTEVRTLKKVANDDFKENLLGLLNSEEESLIKQGLSLNDDLGIFSGQEISDLLIPQVIENGGGVVKYWGQDGLGWILLEKYPNHALWNTLHILGLLENNLTSIPSSIGNLTNLETLILGKNSLSSLPEEIGNLTNLEELSLYYTNLTSLPSWIGKLTNLVELDLSFNKLTSLPKEIGNLKNLETLTLDDNKLTSLPIEMAKLTNLDALELGNNKLKLKDVPKNLRDITEM